MDAALATTHSCGTRGHVHTRVEHVHTRVVVVDSEAPSSSADS